MAKCQSIGVGHEATHRFYERVALLVGKNVPSLDWPGLRISGARACALIATATPPGRPSTPGLTHFQRRRWYLLLEDDY